MVDSPLLSCFLVVADCGPVLLSSIIQLHMQLFGDKYGKMSFSDAVDPLVAKENIRGFGSVLNLQPRRGSFGFRSKARMMCGPLVHSASEGSSAASVESRLHMPGCFPILDGTFRHWAVC